MAGLLNDEIDLVALLGGVRVNERLLAIRQGSDFLEQFTRAGDGKAWRERRADPSAAR